MLIARRGGFPEGLDAAGHGCRYRIELESFFLVGLAGGGSWVVRKAWGDW